MLRRLLALLLALALAPATAHAADELLDFSGKPHPLSEYTGKGKWLVVMLWASDCGACNKEAHQYVDFHERHKGKDATVLGVSMDGLTKKAEAQAFIARHHVNFPNLINEPLLVANLYTKLTDDEWKGTPTFLIYGPTGELMAKQVGAVPVALIEDFIATNAQAVPTTPAR